MGDNDIFLLGNGNRPNQMDSGLFSFRFEIRILWDAIGTFTSHIPFYGVLDFKYFEFKERNIQKK